MRTQTRRRFGVGMIVGLGMSVIGAGAVFALDVVTAIDIGYKYSRRSVSRATADVAMVEIYGAPAVIKADIADALRLPGYFKPAPFLPVEFDPYDDRRDRLVLVFGPAPLSDGICQGPDVPPFNGALDGAPVSVTAAFCDGFEAESRGTLRSISVRDPSSPAFRTAMAQLLRAVLPRRNPNLDPEDCRRMTTRC